MQQVTDGKPYQISNMRPWSKASTSGTSTVGRPKSSPVRKYYLKHGQDQIRQEKRPKTASGAGYLCDRLTQVERESVRRHELRAHLPVRKEKPPPWQAQLESECGLYSQINPATADGEQKPIYIAPGYMLSRSKSKYQMILRDRLFQAEEANNETQQKRSAQVDHELERLVETLKQQVADLNLHLEEERLNHQDTKKKAADFLEDEVTKLKSDHKEAMRRVIDEHKDELHETVSGYEDKLLVLQDRHEAIIAKYKTETELLQGAFESYKSQTNAENRQKLMEQEEHLKKGFAEQLQSHSQDLTNRLKNEHKTLLAHNEREHRKAIVAVEKQCQKEIDTLNRRFANHAVDMHKLKEIEQSYKELDEKHEELNKIYSSCEKELLHSRRESSDLKIRLSAFEKSFEERISEVDSKYKAQLSDLMVQNTQLKKVYLKKCDELFALSAHLDEQKRMELNDNKEMMKALIRTRNNALVSIAADDPKIRKYVQKHRPSSAPSTKVEELKALESAGNTDEYLAKREVPFVRPQSVLEMSAVFNIDDLNSLSKEDLEGGL